MTFKRCFTAFAAVGLWGLHAASPAQDIDLYVNTASATSQLPNVLIVIDNTANWNDAFTAEMNALASVVASLPVDRFRLGFMMYTETGSGNSNPDGAYVRAAVRTLSATNKTLYQNLVNSFDVTNDKTNNGKLGLAMSEVNRYFAGLAAYAGHNKAKRDHAGNTVSGLTHSNAIYALPDNALASSTATIYQSPAPPGTCPNNNFVIFLSNGKSNSNNSDNTEATNHLSAVGGNTTTIPLSPSGMQDEVADEWARYMANKTTNPIITYVIDVVPTTPGQHSADYQALLQSMAFQGKGKYFNVGSATAAQVGNNIQAALNQIFSEIQSVDSVFASASLPLNAQAQGTYLNQVFIGLFRPQENALPRWDGNLKQYQFMLTGTGSGQTLDLADADGRLAADRRHNLIDSCARSFWTPTTTDTYWSFAQAGTTDNPGSRRPSGQCLRVANSSWSNSPDGNLAERGGAAHKLRGISPAARNVKTCTGTCGGASTALTNFNDANADITQSLLGVASASERTGLINWVRGADVTWTGCGGNTVNTCGDEDQDRDTSEMRPSAHADVVHGRPLPVDYPGSGGVVVFYGANDGALRAVNGNKDGGAAIGGVNPGEEIWSFIAPEHFGQLRRLRDQSPDLDYPGAATPPARQRKNWFFDGTIGAWRDGADVWIYPSMRRGGRMLYAFDVSNPAAPALKWKAGCPLNLAQGVAANDAGCSPGLAAIGQTWSEPRIVRVQGHTGPVLIVGGGYDPCEDNEPNSCSSPKGNRVFVLNADTGALLNTLNTTRSVAADITEVDSNADGLVDLAYVADTGGNLYRLNIGAAAPAAWSLTQVAALGCDTPPCAASGTLNRKFLHAPEVVVTSGYNAILLGSGDREHPLRRTHDHDNNHATPEILVVDQAYNVANAFFMVQDKPADAGWLADQSPGACSGGVICLNQLHSVNAPADISSMPALPADLNGEKGWALRFARTGEQVVTSALVAGGVAYFSTHTPVASTSCGPNLGEARPYRMNFLTMGGASSGIFYQGGLAPSPVAGIVSVASPSGGTVNVPFIMGTWNVDDSSNPMQPTLLSSPFTGQRARVYWYIER